MGLRYIIAWTTSRKACHNHNHPRLPIAHRLHATKRLPLEWPLNEDTRVQRPTMTTASATFEQRNRDAIGGNV